MDATVRVLNFERWFAQAVKEFKGPDPKPTKKPKKGTKK